MARGIGSPPLHCMKYLHTLGFIPRSVFKNLEIFRIRENLEICLVMETCTTRENF